MDLKTLEGKILANRSSIHQICQCFPPPTFRAIRYLVWAKGIDGSVIVD